MFDELRGLSRAAKVAIGAAGLAILLLVSALAGAGNDRVAPAAGASPYPPLPMAPTGSYTVGDQYYAGMLPMPNYVGWTLQAAVNDLGQRGITVAITNPAAATALIVQQSPYPGTRVSPATANVIQLMVPSTPTTTTTTTTTPPPTTTSEAPSNTDVDVDVDHHNSRDGALTGGYCRRKWWC